MIGNSNVKKTHTKTVRKKDYFYFEPIPKTYLCHKIYFYF